VFKVFIYFTGWWTPYGEAAVGWCWKLWSYMYNTTCLCVRQIRNRTKIHMMLIWIYCRAL